MIPAHKGSEGMIARRQVARALQVLDFSQEKHELIHRKVHIVAVIVLVEQHGDAVDVG